MSFLQPWMLFGLPLVALPVVIHLVHRNRHQSVRWAAMRFLVEANRMDRGMARLRHYLILLARMMAVAALLVAASRPLLSGTIGGFEWGRPEATLILLDRSASMERRDLQTGESKRLTALRRLYELFTTRRGGERLVLFESAGSEHHLLENAEGLLDLPQTRGTASTADLPGMFERALAYLAANEIGRADLWICSDLQEGDWDPESGRWKAIRERLAERKGIQLSLLAYREREEENWSVRVSNLERRQRGDRAELVMDIAVHREDAPERAGRSNRRIPVTLELNGTRSVLEGDGSDDGAVYRGHRIAVDRRLRSGWGLVSIPEDANPLDDRFYFVFAEAPPHQTVIVSDSPEIAESFRLVLETPVEPGRPQRALILPPDRVDEIDWQKTGLLIWQADLPSQRVETQLEAFVASGRSVVFFPPLKNRGGAVDGMGWGPWVSVSEEAGRGLSWWRGDEDLLGHAGSGEALPLEALRVFQLSAVETATESASLTPLARLKDGRPLLVRTTAEAGAVYFCGTLPKRPFSSWETEAVSFYVMLQRALAMGTRALSRASHVAADASLFGELKDMQKVVSAATSSVSESGLLPAVFREGDTWVAVNRTEAEDRGALVRAAEIDGLFAGLPYQRIDDWIGNQSSLTSEVWRLVLVGMAMALLAEAILCLPEKRRVATRWGVSPGGAPVRR